MIGELHLSFTENKIIVQSNWLNLLLHAVLFKGTFSVQQEPVCRFVYDYWGWSYSCTSTPWVILSVILTCSLNNSIFSVTQNSIEKVTCSNGHVVGFVYLQLFLMPILVPVIGEERLLSTGLLIGCINVSLSSLFLRLLTESFWIFSTYGHGIKWYDEVSQIWKE